MPSYKISGVEEQFLEKCKYPTDRKVQGRGPLTTVMYMLLKNLGANSKLEAPGE